jgi:hypothetical protein
MEKKEIKDLNFDHNKVYLVTGMHRSGTSFIAKALQNAGVYLGEEDAILGPNQHNPLGHYENAHFNHVSDRLLIDAGGSWDRLPPREQLDKHAEKKQWQDNLKSKVKEHERKFWGWKDPRLTATLPIILPYLDGDVYLIACFRKPSRTVKSLQKRQQGMREAHARKITDQYNKRLIETIKEFVEL